MKWIKYVSLLPLILALFACTDKLTAESPSANSVNSCVISPPDRSLVEKSKVVAVKVDLEKFASEVSSDDQFKSKVEETYQRVPDKDVVCSMLLRTVACLSAQGRSDQQVGEFREYLQSTRSCESTDRAIVSVDNIVQVMVDDAYRFERPPVSFDVFVRNSGDSAALISSVKIWFDEHLRESRLPADMQKVSAIYSVAVDSSGATVTGAELRSPAKAFYPNPGSKVLIVESPIAQTLPPRSTDRFRVTITLTDGAEVRGTLEQLRAEVNFNDNQAVSSKTLALVKQGPCFKMVVSGVTKEICR